MQVGLLVSLPVVIATLIEPFAALAGDSKLRRHLIAGGGIGFALSLSIVALSRSFLSYFAGFSLLYLSSGAFVSLSQATLMDLAPDRRVRNMARWTLAGSLGSVAGPLLVGGADLIGASWRGLWVGFAALTVPLIVVCARGARARRAYPIPAEARTGGFSLRRASRDMLRALGKPKVWQWVLLLAAADATLDVLSGYLAIYLVKVVKATPAGAAFDVGVWTLFGLAGDLFVVRWLERFDPPRFLRVGASITLVLLPAFLLAPWEPVRLALLALIALANAGRYSVLQAKLYEALEDRSAAALVASDASALLAALLPFAVGLLAHAIGLRWAMWILLVGPLTLLAGPSGRTQR